MTYCINVLSLTYQTNLKSLNTAQTQSVRSLFATTQQPHSTDFFTAQKFLPLAKMIQLQEGTIAYKVNSGQYLLSNFLTDGHVDHMPHQLRNDEDLRIPLHTTTHSHMQLFIRYKAIKTWNILPDYLRSPSSLL